MMKIFFAGWIIIRNFAASFRQNGKIEESAFSLDSALGELGHFTKDYAGIRENDCLLGVYSYALRYRKWS